MSIFKGTLSPFIASQLKARETIIFSGKGDRGSDFLQYTTGKNSWVRMSSFVNVGNEDKLARSYILEGGVPYGNKLRYGAGKLDESAYGGNLANTTDERPYGYRPMPGIVSVTISNKGAYGSLRQATVRYQCWDRHQLDQLEKLYMRVGFTVLLEWGWSQYLDHDVNIAGNINDEPTNIGVNYFLKNNLINVFDTTLTEEKIYDEIDKGVLDYRGNWDGMLGYVQNFSWQLMPNGGFDCTTTLISRGEVLSELKGSSNPYTMIDSGISGDDYIKTQYDPNNGTVQEKPVLSLFEKIFLNLKAYINQGEIYDSNGEFYVKYGGGVPSDTTRKNNSDAIKDQVDKTIANIKKEYDITKFLARDSNASPAALNKYAFYNNYELDLNWLKVNNKPIVGGTDGTTLEYIRFEQLVHLLNAFFIPKSQDPLNKGEQLVYIANPFNTEFLVCEDTVSIDPTTCLFTNKNATFITNILSHTCGDDDIGFTPLKYAQQGDYNVMPFTSSYGNVAEFSDIISTKSTARSNGDPILVGNLGNISICITKIIEVYRETMTSDGVNIIDYLQNLLEQISLALGGINDFKVYTERNIIHIIDAKYLETSGDPEGSYSQKFKFQLIGLESICRDVKINSRIFSEQASMIAIGAAASGENKNLGDIYSTTQQKFNEGLKDRLIPQLGISSDYDPNNYYLDIFQNLIKLTNYIQKKVMGYVDPCIIDFRLMPYGADANANPLQKVVVPSREEIINASSLLKTFLLQLDGKDLDFKALIPLELEITLDGISGFVIGQIFTVDESILPTFYKTNKVGFIITGVTQNLQNNDWTTTLKTQMCLLDNDKIDKVLDLTRKKALKTTLGRFRTAVIGSSFSALAMADYLVYLTIGIIEQTGRGIDGIDYSGLTDFPGRGNVKKGNLGVAATQDLPVNKQNGTFQFDFYRFFPPDGYPGSNGFFNQTNPNVTGANSINQAVSYVARYIKNDLPFYVSGGGDCYLKRWYDISKANNVPDLPNTYEELWKFTDPLDNTKTIDLEQYLLNFNKEVIGSIDYSAVNPNTIKASEIFFYNQNYLGLTPLGVNGGGGYGLGSFVINPGTQLPKSNFRLNYTSDVNKSVADLALNTLFTHYLVNGVINRFLNTIPNATDRQYLNPRAHPSFYSLEAPTGTVTIWQDGKKDY